MKRITQLKTILFIVPLILTSCGRIADNATTFRSVIEKKASQLNQSANLEHKAPHIKTAVYFPHQHSPYHIILIPGGGATKKDLLEKGIPCSIVNGIFQKMHYLGRIQDDFISGDWIIVWNSTKEEPSWTGSNIQSQEILHIAKQVEATTITLQKINDKTIIIISLE